MDTNISAYVRWRFLDFDFFCVSHEFGFGVISTIQFLFLPWSCLSETSIKPTYISVSMLGMVLMKEVNNIFYLENEEYQRAHIYKFSTRDLHENIVLSTVRFLCVLHWEHETLFLHMKCFTHFSPIFDLSILKHLLQHTNYRYQVNILLSNHN